MCGGHRVGGGRGLAPVSTAGRWRGVCDPARSVVGEAAEVFSRLCEGPGGRCRFRDTGCVCVGGKQVIHLFR